MAIGKSVGAFAGPNGKLRTQDSDKSYIFVLGHRVSAPQKPDS